MQSLLRWSIENTPTGPAATDAPAPRRDLDPAIIDHILGKPDAVLMKEALAIALDHTQSEDTRVAALDEFEMLIEQIDNASSASKSHSRIEPELTTTRYRKARDVAELAGIAYVFGRVRRGQAPGALGRRHRRTEQPHSSSSS
jgi:hypothetical protein